MGAHIIFVNFTSFDFVWCYNRLYTVFILELFFYILILVTLLLHTPRIVTANFTNKCWRRKQHYHFFFGFISLLALFRIGQIYIRLWWIVYRIRFSSKFCIFLKLNIFKITTPYIFLRKYNYPQSFFPNAFL